MRWAWPLSGGSRLVGDIEIVSRDILVGEVVLPFGVGIPLILEGPSFLSGSLAF